MDPTTLITPPFYVQRNDAYAHFDTISGLWEKKWRPAAAMGIYPFMDANVEDFDPIFEELVKISGDDAKFLYDADALAAPFQPHGMKLMERAAEAEKKGDIPTARDLYLRAGAVFRIGRFPAVRSEGSALSWKNNKDAYSRGAQYLDPPSSEVMVPFTHKKIDAGDEDRDIPAYLRVPNGTPPKGGWPIILFIGGIDAWRTDNNLRIQLHIDSGFAVLIFEIPGTGDCPVSRPDPESPDRLMSSVIDWVHDNAAQYKFDTTKICARGISTGGYYALRVAHTHAERLHAVVGQGAPAHYMFTREWVMNMDRMEYPYALGEAIAAKFGHGNGDIESFLASDPINKYSLIQTGITKKESCRLLIINGMEDGVFPIEDSILVGLTGRKKELVLRANRAHMGNPGGDDILNQWLVDQVKS